MPITVGTVSLAIPSAMQWDFVIVRMYVCMFGFFSKQPSILNTLKTVHFFVRIVIDVLLCYCFRQYRRTIILYIPIFVWH